MSTENEPIVKRRGICFQTPHPDPRQALTAARLLADVEGVMDLAVVADDCLEIAYELRHHTLQSIEALLSELGFHLDNSLMANLRRALYHYTEETERANCGCAAGRTTRTRDIFVNRYQHLPHGCRDCRPDFWRQYL